MGYFETENAKMYINIFPEDFYAYLSTFSHVYDKNHILKFGIVTIAKKMVQNIFSINQGFDRSTLVVVYTTVPPPPLPPHTLSF